MKPTESTNEIWAAAASLISDIVEEQGAFDLRSLRQYSVPFAQLEPALTQIAQTWNAARRDEVVPLRGYNFWFPRRVANYQILGPLSQTVEETVCLARQIPSGRILGLRLLAPGCGGTAEQIRFGIDDVLDLGNDQGIAFCAFQWGETPVLASTRELMEAAREPELVPVKREIARPQPAQPVSPPHAKTAAFRARLHRIAERVRGIWKRPSLSKGAFAFLAIATGAILFAGSALPTHQASPARQAEHRGRGNAPQNTALAELNLDRLDRMLAADPEDAQASALRAILLARQKSRSAWRDYETLQRLVPGSFAAGFVEECLERELGPKPRMLASAQESAAEKPSTPLDYSLLGMNAALPHNTPADAAFSK